MLITQKSDFVISFYKIVCFSFLCSQIAACNGIVIDYQEQSEHLKPVELQEPLPDKLPDVVKSETSLFAGVVKNVLNGENLADMLVKTSGIQPPLETKTAENGDFEVKVPVGSRFYAIVEEKQGFSSLAAVDMSTPVAKHQQNLYHMTEANLKKMAADAGIALNTNCGITLIRTKSSDVLQAGVTVELSGADASGPYYVDDNFIIDTALKKTSSRGMLLYFNVCDQGSNQLANVSQVSIFARGDYISKAASIYIKSAMISIYELPVEAADVYVEPSEQEIALVDFKTEVMPLFARYGCVGCHQEGANASATGLLFDLNAQSVHYALTSKANLVNPLDPSSSLLLTKPLYEDPPNHPNATFFDVTDENYQLIYSWIEQGALLAEEILVDEGEAEFISDILPIFTERYCIGCHNTESPQGNLDLSAPANEVLAKIDADLINLITPEYSLLLNNPFCGTDQCTDDQNRFQETHPLRIFYTIDDPSYIKLKDWLILRAAQLNSNAEQPQYAYKENVVFAEQIGRFAELECVRCHNQTSNSAGLNLEGSAYQIYQSLTDINNPGVIVAADAEQSLLYTKVNAAYPDVTHGGGKDILDRFDNFAQYFGGWIEEGAIGPENLTPTWQEIEEIFSSDRLSCAGCHNTNLASGGLDLSLVGQELYNVLILQVDPNYIIQDSQIMGKIFVGKDYLYKNVSHGGPKKNIATYKEDYTLLQAWISGQTPGPL